MIDKTELKLYVLHKNKKGEWGMWREYFKNGTAVYWQPANDFQMSDINWYLKRTDVGLRKRVALLKDYINKQQKIYQQLAPEPNHFQICR